MRLVLLAFERIDTSLAKRSAIAAALVKHRRREWQNPKNRMMSLGGISSLCDRLKYKAFGNFFLFLREFVLSFLVMRRKRVRNRGMSGIQENGFVFCVNSLFRGIL